MHPQFTYRVAALDKSFTDKGEAFREAKQLAASSGKSVEVVRYSCRNIDQMNQAPYYTYNAQTQVSA